MECNGPNDQSVTWVEGTGEDTRQDSDVFQMATFGSSFNVTDRPKALQEVNRILQDRGWFAAMWNHRNLEDPIQSQIEEIIRNHISGYSYGARREDQTEVIAKSGLFGQVQKIEGTVIHTQAVEETVEAWRSHATLHRQAGDQFNAIIEQISGLLYGLGRDSIQIPYTTRIWLAQLN